MASFLTLEGEAELVGRLKSLKVLAGPTRRPHDDATEADEAGQAFCTYFNLIVMYCDIFKHICNTRIQYI